MERLTNSPQTPAADASSRAAAGGKDHRPEDGAKSPTSVDVEVFARNAARMIEEGGKALAAYMRPREEGKLNDERAEEVTDVVKTLGHVLEYWLADPQRMYEMQSRLGKSYLDLWASAAKRMTGEETPPVAKPDPKDKRFSDPEWSTNQFFDFLKQAYLLTADWANHLVVGADRARPAYPPQGGVLRPPDRQRAGAIELRDDQSRTVARDAGIERGQSRARNAEPDRGHQAGGGNLKIRQSDGRIVRGRAKSRGHAGQGRVSERPHPAHPVRAVDTEGAGRFRC